VRLLWELVWLGRLVGGFIRWGDSLYLQAMLLGGPLELT
jgi:hypothetical protein